MNDSLPRYRLLLLAAILHLAPAGAFGRSPRLAIPTPGSKAPSGLRITIETNGLEANGYRPLAIEVTPAATTPAGPKPLPRDRQIRLVIRPHSSHATFAPAVSQIIELPEGSTSVRTTMVVPQSGPWYALGIETFEGGEKLRDLSAEQLGWWNHNNWDWTETRPALLFIDRAVPPKDDRDASIDAFQKNPTDPAPTFLLPDVRTLAKLFPDLNNNQPPAHPPGPVINTAGKISDTTLLWQIDTQSRARLLPPAELPANWVELSQADTIVLSYADLQLLHSDYRPALAALCDWLSTGPLLVVYGAGDDFAHLTDIERLLELPALAAAEEQLANHKGWRLPAVKPDGQPDLHPDIGSLATSPATRIINRPGRPAVARQVPKSNVPKVDPSPTTMLKDPFFLWRGAGQGCVVVIAGDERPFPGNEADWRWVFSTVPDRHWRWCQRNGFSLHRTNDDYWKMLIPGVGDAPVWSFLILVSLFAAVIGPLNYWFLRRAGRLYLLLLTVPVGAAVMTTAIFSYAIITDGLAVRLRSRSFTDLDQRTGRAAAWAWQSYYAAVAPSQGLVFPEDATVFPVLHEPNRRMYNARRLHWDEGQHLQSGYLGSRTATQFMVQRATKTSVKLVVRDRSAQKEPPQVENRLGTSLRYLLLHDRNGEYYALDALAVNETKSLVSTTPEQAVAAFQKFVQPARLRYPPEFDPNDSRNSLSFVWLRSNIWSGIDGHVSAPAMASSLLETQLAAATNPATHPFQPGSYVAVIEQSPIVPIGVPRTREEASLHLLRGTYE